MRTRILLVALGLLLAPVAAQATLMLDITGVPGSDETTWTFSGESVAGSGGEFESSSDIPLGGPVWDLELDYTSSDDLEITTIISGNATIMIGTDSRAIDLGYIGGFNLEDQITVGVSDPTDSSGDFAFSAGDTVSWTGAIVFLVDITAMSNGGLPLAVSTTTFSNTKGTLALDLTISKIPEPSTALLLLLGLVALGRRSRV